MKNKRNIKIFFDFDHTLFNTNNFITVFQQSFENLGVDEQLFFEAFSRSKKEKVYHPEIHFSLIKKERNISLIEMENKLNAILEESYTFLYPDTVPFLKKWHRKAEMIILSLGQEKFQRKKIMGSKIGKFFKKVLITQNFSKKNLLSENFNRERKIFFVDDNIEVLFGLKKDFPSLKTVAIDRGKREEKENILSQGIDFLVNNLEDLENILKG